MKERILSDKLVSLKSLLELIVTCASIFCEPRKKNIELGSEEMASIEGRYHRPRGLWP